jgi:hypothetical protein
MTKGTLIFLRELVATQTLFAGAPDFEKVAALVVTALAELDEELADGRLVT